MVKAISVRNLRANLARILEYTCKHMDRFIISRHGEPEAVLMSMEDYEGWLETLEIMSSKHDLEEIRKARKELGRGMFYTFEDVFGSSRKKQRA